MFFPHDHIDTHPRRRDQINTPQHHVSSNPKTSQVFSTTRMVPVQRRKLFAIEKMARRWHGQQEDCETRWACRSPRRSGRCKSWADRAKTRHLHASDHPTATLHRQDLPTQKWAPACFPQTRKMGLGAVHFFLNVPAFGRKNTVQKMRSPIFEKKCIFTMYNFSCGTKQILKWTHASNNMHF